MGASVFDCWIEDLHCVRLQLLIENTNHLHFEPSLQSDTSVTVTSAHNCMKYSLLSEPGLVVMAITANDIPVQSYPSDTTFQHSIDKFHHSGAIDNELLTTPVYINITVLPCPLGFILSDSSTHKCVCDHLLRGHDILTCNISN